MERDEEDIERDSRSMTSQQPQVQAPCRVHGLQLEVHFSGWFAHTRCAKRGARVSVDRRNDRFGGHQKIDWVIPSENAPPRGNIAEDLPLV